jgi:hypothetical protein
MDFMHLCIPLVYISADAKAEKTSSAEAAKAKSCLPRISFTERLKSLMAWRQI